MNSSNRSTSFNRRALSFGSPRVNRKSWVWRPFHVVVVIGAFVTFLSAIGGGYFYVLPNLSQAFHGYSISKFNSSIDSCNVYDGTWVQGDSYPLYNASECPFVEQGFNCLGNGRRDQYYLKWKWKPNNCDIPRFSVKTTLEKLRNKRVVFVGDSMSRTQWESLICMLMTGVEDKRSVYEVNKNKISKRIRFLGVRFSAFNFTIEFYRSVFLVQHGWTPKHAPRRVKSTLRLDVLDNISSEWINSDILIFNTGHWWVPGKLFDTFRFPAPSGQIRFLFNNFSNWLPGALPYFAWGCYFQFEDSLKLGMSIATAFRTAMGTWASWVDSKIDAKRTHVFFRTFEPSHWSDQSFRFCEVTKYPVSETKGRDHSIFSDTMLEVVKNMTVPVNVLHITSMSAFRKDAHVGNWSDNPSVPDCSHWCLPGVPDVWNEIVLSYLHAVDHEFPLL